MHTTAFDMSGFLENKEVHYESFILLCLGAYCNRATKPSRRRISNATELPKHEHQDMHANGRACRINPHSLCLQPISTGANSLNPVCSL
jgi:hypothetical protein